MSAAAPGPADKPAPKLAAPQLAPAPRQPATKPSAAKPPAPAPAPGLGLSGAQILRLGLGSWSGQLTCDITGESFGQGSLLGIRIRVYMDKGAVLMTSKQQLLDPPLDCVFDSEGACARGADGQCGAGLVPIVCTVQSFARWTDDCAGFVRVPRLRTIKVCLDDGKKEMYPAEISPTCSRVTGTWKKALPGSGP